MHVKRHGAIARDEIRNTNDQSDAAHILEHSPRPTARVAALSFPSGAMTHDHRFNLVTELDHPIRCSSPAECLPAKADIAVGPSNRYPRKRTLDAAIPMSAMGHKRTLMSAHEK